MALEIACFNASSAIAAVKAGANRIELCADYAAGGVTPSLSTLQAICAAVPDLQQPTPRDGFGITINVMIRPRGGEFSYTPAEFDQMKKDIEMFKESKRVDGFVFGILCENKMLDEKRNRELVEAAKPLPCTFHRAIDEVEDLDVAVETIIDCGFKSILTSGGANTASEGMHVVRYLQEKYHGKLDVIIGGGIRSTNVLKLKGETGVKWLHSAALTGDGEEVDEEEVRRMLILLQYN
ncbi:hypothetical protein BU25DRAFT_197168 [Macroventuria anomochaeta]|uniref:Uncharacterized protein n=1 Tax=Macroventuria anomochaeta TaxID=301207 RepID=A0ACB6SC65_9PLEO|nr:uncharacterized protein BU25DRAFT_197168 [Macroventuria anomochaeta]KAF2631801.1 hypothetical protein BU25DRAFT_197168 [Macroventuria anomochaeta]